MSHKLTSRDLPYSEPSATIVWEALYNLGIEERTILWNALPMRPHKSRDEQSNRTPTSEEFEIGERALQMLVREFPLAKVVAVGRKAEKSLKAMNIRAEYVRHPANGGATKFAQGLELLVSG